jgi:hypothetical protein
MRGKDRSIPEPDHYQSARRISEKGLDLPVAPYTDLSW